LQQLAVEPGSRVLLMLPRVIAWWEVMLGLEKARLVAIPATTLLTPSDIEYRIRRAEVAVVLTDACGAEKVDQIPHLSGQLDHKILVGEDPPRNDWLSYQDLLTAARPQPPDLTNSSDQPALIYFTSGTTGPPKMVTHSHASYGFAHRTTGHCWLDLSPEDLHWNLSDTGWAKAAWSSLFGTWHCGATLFVRESPGRFDPQDVLACLSQYPITTMCAAPTVYRLLVQQDLQRFQPAALRHCVAAGEPLDAATIHTWQEATGVTIRDGYGQTESVLLCGNYPGVPVKPGSMGLPAPGIELAVIDPAGNVAPTGTPGDLAVRTGQHRPLGLFHGYWHDEPATTRCFRNGWYVTGDSAYTDEDGYFWFVGRADDIITSSAYRIGPFEVESALVAHPAVAEAAVVGKPDALRGEVVKAFVLLASGYTASDALVNELQQFVKTTTAPYKYPREIEFVDALPKTVSGKIRRAELRGATGAG
nr:AMP-binding protein [Planctomycetales bacterium]